MLGPYPVPVKQLIKSPKNSGGAGTSTDRVIKIVLEIESEFTLAGQVRQRTDSDETFSFSHASGSRRGTITMRPTIVNE